MNRIERAAMERSAADWLWLVSATIFAAVFVGLPLLCGYMLADITPLPQNAPTLAPPQVTLGQEIVSQRTCEVLHNSRVIDGDTIQADIHLGAGVLIENETIRLSGLDAWERTKRRRTVDVSDSEVTKGERATESLDSLIGNGGTRILACEGRDVYGRILGRLYVVKDDGSIVDVAREMIARNHDRTTKPDGSKR